MNFEVALEAAICGEDCTDDQIAAVAETVMEALVDMEVDDPFVGGSIATRKFEIALVVDAASEEEEDAFVAGNRLIAEALEAAGVEFESKDAFAWSQKAVRPAAAV